MGFFDDVGDAFTSDPSKFGDVANDIISVPTGIVNRAKDTGDNLLGVFNKTATNLGNVVEGIGSFFTSNTFTIAVIVVGGAVIYKVVTD